MAEGNNGAGKGDTYRKLNKNEYDKNYVNIFGEDKPTKENQTEKSKRSTKPVVSWILPVEESLFLDLDPKTGEETSEKKCYIRIPKEVCRKMRINVNTPMSIRVRNGRILITRQVKRKKKGKSA